MYLIRHFGVIAAAILLATAAASIAGASTFTIGDLYLSSQALPIGPGIQHIDPVSGAVTLLVHLPFYPLGTFAYDPYRDRLLCVNGGLGTGGLMTVDAIGTVTQLSPTLPAPQQIAPRGDGILYVYFVANGNFGYVDQADQLHDLLNQAGTGPYTLGSGHNEEELYYDLATNSLIAFSGDGSTIPACPNPSQTCLLKIPLTASGTQVASAITAAQFLVSPSGEAVVGASQAPSDQVLWVVDDNSNSQEPRMQLLDPASMGSVTYAANGPYTGAAATNAGTYSSLRGQAVVLDTFADSLRAFSFGQVGYGAEFGGGNSSDGGSGETARLVEIRSSPLMTGVDRPASASSGALAFSAATPNPFHNATELSFTLPAAGSVMLTIHDATGRTVRTLFEGSLTAGAHTLRWDGRNSGGSAVAAGIYFARLTSAEAQVMRKVILER